MLTLKEVKRLNKKANVIPLAKRIPADLDTPVSAFLKLAHRKRHAFLLESIEGGEKLARYSFLGYDPFLIVESSGDGVMLRNAAGKTKIDADPLELVEELFAQYRPARVEGLPRFTGGAVGHLSYDAIRWLEDIPDKNPEVIGVPVLRFGLYRRIVVFDHLRQEIIVVANILHEPGSPGLNKAYKETCAAVDSVIKRLRSSLRRPAERPIKNAPPEQQYSRGQFERMVQEAKEYIREGDIFQVVLSQRWSVKSNRTPLEVYRRLRRLNPSPYMFLLNSGNQSIIGSSPEMLVRVEKDAIETRPIAGTRPRGVDAAEDARLSDDLLADPKELAEHTMLLDLGRNDLGRVSRPGTVQVREKMVIEKYSHVLHMVSSVVGKLQPKISPLEGLVACFPAGTVSGAPKIRAMEIIDELESERRGVYAGAVAYIDFWGNLDSCISIRTVVRRGKTYYIQAGAGIVADSEPNREFEETRAKARVLVEAVSEGDE